MRCRNKNEDGERWAEQDRIMEKRERRGKEGEKYENDGFSGGDGCMIMKMMERVMIKVMVK